MKLAINVDNANSQLLDTIQAVLKSFSDVKFHIKTISDYSKIENDILKSQKELEKKRKNGTLKSYNDVDKMFEDILNDKI